MPYNRKQCQERNYQNTLIYRRRFIVSSAANIKYWKTMQELEKVMSQSQKLSMKHHDARQFTQLVMHRILFKSLSVCVWTEPADSAGHLSVAWKLGRSAQQIAVAISCENIVNFWNLTHSLIPASILFRNLKRKGKAQSLLSLTLSKTINNFF